MNLITSPAPTLHDQDTFQWEAVSSTIGSPITIEGHAIEGCPLVTLICDLREGLVDLNPAAARHLAAILLHNAELAEKAAA